MKTRCIAFAVFCVFSLPAIAVEPDIISITGVGQNSCGAYLEDTRGPNWQEFTRLYQTWGAGFMAGMNVGSDRWRITIDLPTIKAWIDKSCLEDPTKSVIQVLSELHSKQARLKK